MPSILPRKEPHNAHHPLTNSNHPLPLDVAAYPEIPRLALSVAVPGDTTTKESIYKI